MGQWQGYLQDDELDAVRIAAINAGLATSDAMLAALTSSMPPLFAGTLQGSGLPPGPRLLVQLNQLNDIHNLRNGDVPLAQWLEAAIALAGDRPEVDVFEDALDMVLLAPSEPIDGGLQPADTGGANMDIRPEAMVAGSDQTVDVSFLEGAMRSSRSVVKVLVQRHEDGEAVFLSGDEPWLINGTGWFIGPNLLVTNHHVINARRSFPVEEPDATELDFRMQAESLTVLYDYLRRDQPSAQTVAGPGALVAADKALDFAILRLTNPPEARAPLPLRKRIIKKKVEQALGTRVNVLQHPNGDPMRLGFRDNFVVVGNDDGLSYLTDTSFGSSGSPVCDDRWFVAALHSGSRNVSTQDLVLRGKKVRRENHGIPIPTLLKHLEANHPDLHAEILAGQA